MSSILFDHHLGLGDHLICSGIVREYCKTYDRVGLCCLTRNYPSVAFLYRDLSNLTIHPVHSYAEKRWFRLSHTLPFGAHQYEQARVIGAYDQESGLLFERQIYATAGVSLEKKWDAFFVARDREREESLVTKTAVTRPYVFVHDDQRYPIDPARLPADRAVIRPRPELTDTIFDYCTLIEQADEIHVIDSSFMFLIDCLPAMRSGQKLFVHRYARPNTPCQMPLLKKAWQILT